MEVLNHLGIVQFVADPDAILGDGPLVSGLQTTGCSVVALVNHHVRLAKNQCGRIDTVSFPV